MSRTGEILRRYGLDKTPITQEIEETKLWPRFEKVKQVVLKAIKGDDCEGIERIIKTRGWDGEDRGTYDHVGTICGTLDNIDINLNIKGITYDYDGKLNIGGVNGWTVMNSGGRVLKILGTFKSPDQRMGYVEINNDNYYQKNYEAYWLQIEGNKLRLEQVVENGRVFNAEDLKRFRNNIETEHGVSLPAMRFVKIE